MKDLFEVRVTVAAAKIEGKLLKALTKVAEHYAKELDTIVEAITDFVTTKLIVETDQNVQDLKEEE